MTHCDYRHDCWHEDTCCARESPLVKPGCWMPKGEGWKAEPTNERVFGRAVENLAYMSQSGKTPKEVIVLSSTGSVKVEVDPPKEADQGELF
jgi:hypothetical protein